MNQTRVGDGWHSVVAVAMAAAAVHSAAPHLFAQEPDPLRLDRLATDEEISFVMRAPEPRWEEAMATPIHSLTSDDFSDLEFLRARLRGVRIVQLGESGHGMGETFALKARLVRFLHEELGFDVLAMESDLYQCADMDGRPDSGARALIFGCAFGVWHVEEVVPAFELVRASRATDRPLRLAGFDVQPIGSNKDHRPAFLAKALAATAPDLADEVRVLDSTYLAKYAEGGSARREWMRAHRDSLLTAYGKFEAALEGASGHHALVARQTIHSILAYTRQQTAPDNLAYAEARNFGMAENVRFLAEGLFPDSKLIIWGHNTHVRHASEEIPLNPEGGTRAPARDMGSWLHDWYGDELYTIGFYAYRGTAVDNAREPYAVEPATPSHLEYRLARAGYRLGYFDLARQGNWTAAPQVVRYSGRHDQEIVPARQYDGLVLLVDVSPPTFLYDWPD